MTQADVKNVRVIEPDTRAGRRIRDLFVYRELMTNLVRKELHVKYKSSSLGFVWSLLNPALYLAIFWLVFENFLPGNVPIFPIFLLSGLLGWNLWSTSLGGSASSILGNASLVTKVYFPREVLPLSIVGASVMHFFFQFMVLLAGLAVFRYRVSPAALLLVPSALATELIVLAGATLLLAVLNVYFRDLEHLLELALLAWFWMTPIVYPIGTVLESLGPLRRLYLLNPMAHIVLAFQRGVYGDVTTTDAAGNVKHLLVDAPVWWYMRNLGIVALAGLLLCAIGWKVFRSLESRLAEEL